MNREPHQDAGEWLRQQPSLDELLAAYPDEWQKVRRELDEVVNSGDLEQLKAYAAAVGRPVRASPSLSGGREAEEVRRRMATLALRSLSLSAATGVTKGKVRFNLVNGWIAQKLLFKRDLERKPVSLLRFRLLWPLLSQKAFLMPLVERKGIYCFYSKRLVKELARLIGDRSCLEIAAGDGTLSRFLGDEGVRITATDDHSWAHTVTFPDTVLRQDASEALRVHRPQAVISSWPPAGNAFEKDVFDTPSVELYVVIGSRHAFASGNWLAYDDQDGFDYTEDARLSRLVLPPELEPAVYVFRRKQSPGPGVATD